MILLSGINPSNIGQHEIEGYAQAYTERYEKMIEDEEKGGDLKNDANLWVEKVMFDLIDYFPSKALLVIDEVLLQTDNETVLCNLAAGPLEDLLSKYGEEVMPQIEFRIKNNSQFRDLFSWVWQPTSDEL